MIETSAAKKDSFAASTISASFSDTSSVDTPETTSMMTNSSMPTFEGRREGE